MPWVTLLLLSQVPHSLLGVAWSSTSSATLVILHAFAFYQITKLLLEASSLEDVPAKFKTLVEF